MSEVGWVYGPWGQIPVTVHELCYGNKNPHATKTKPSNVRNLFHKEIHPVGPNTLNPKP